MGLKVLLTCVGGGLSSQAVRFLKESKIHKNIKGNQKVRPEAMLTKKVMILDVLQIS